MKISPPGLSRPCGELSNSSKYELNMFRKRRRERQKMILEVFVMAQAFRLERCPLIELIKMRPVRQCLAAPCVLCASSRPDDRREDSAAL
jgi:hypothetical protein